MSYLETVQLKSKIYFLSKLNNKLNCTCHSTNNVIIYSILIMAIHTNPNTDIDLEVNIMKTMNLNCMFIFIIDKFEVYCTITLDELSMSKHC